MKASHIIAIEKILRERKEAETLLFEKVHNDFFAKHRHEIWEEPENKEEYEADSKAYDEQKKAKRVSEELYDSFMDHDWH